MKAAGETDLLKDLDDSLPRFDYDILVNSTIINITSETMIIYSLKVSFYG